MLDPSFASAMSTLSLELGARGVVYVGVLLGAGTMLGALLGIVIFRAAGSAASVSGAALKRAIRRFTR